MTTPYVADQFNDLWIGPNGTIPFASTPVGNVAGDVAWTEDNDTLAASDGSRVLISAFTTSSQLSAWQARVTADTDFISAGDYATNSPGDWDRIVADKTEFAADPSVWIEDGPTGTGRIPSGVSNDPGWGGWVLPGSAALWSLIQDNATVRGQVADHLVAQAQVDRLDFSDNTQWQNEGGTDLNPFFEYANLVSGLVLAMGWVEAGDPSAMSPSEKNTVHTWFFRWAEWCINELTTAYAKTINSFDESSAPPWGGAKTQTWSKAYDGLTNPYDGNSVNVIGTTARYFNNRRNCMIRSVGLVAKKLDYAGFATPASNDGWTVSEMLTAAKNMAKGWIVFSVFPEEHYEFDRVGSNGGLFYPWQTISPILTLAHCLAVSGDTSLWDFTTRDGGYNTISESGDDTKSLEWAVVKLAGYTDQVDVTRTKNGVTLGMSSQNSSAEYGHDQTAAIGFSHYSDLATIKARIERNASGMTGWKSGMNGPGSRPPWVGDWGVWPAAHFLFNGITP